mmetsp:Transcript_16766/g.34143  ORF Transcript_16766/g.34143 Transcript_16766/m.34143 type:complete len:322 (-) Transcript_16766:195-1160(-)
MSASTISYPHILSIANALAYGLNTLETFGFGPFSSRYSSEQDNSSVSQKYQTIITPNGIAFSIWGIIFLSQAICVILNLFFDQLRPSPLMVNGVSWWFVLVCIAQTAWSPAFAYEKIPLSAFFMGCIFVPLVAIVVGQYKVVTKLSERGTSNGPVTRSNYWLLQFPFEIHFGWISAAFALNLNILLVNSGVSSGAQSLMAGISLALLALMALVCLFLIKRPNYTLPWVVVWATVSCVVPFFECNLCFHFSSNLLELHFPSNASGLDQLRAKESEKDDHRNVQLQSDRSISHSCRSHVCHSSNNRMFGLAVQERFKEKSWHR